MDVGVTEEHAAAGGLSFDDWALVALRIGRPRRHRWLALGAVAAVVATIAAITVPAVVSDRQERTPGSPAAVDRPAQWRTEYWHGISVQVPAGWAWARVR